MSETEATMQDAAADKTWVPEPLTVQQEDAIIHTRITNDEKALRRVTRKFHNYTSVAYSPVVLPPPKATPSLDDAREAFLVELSSFQLSLKKSLLVCEAEARQVQEYQRERERIANEHVRLREEIGQLKVDLERAQIERKRKIEYDVVAEKVNSLPTRDELQQSIDALENDMAAIRAEHENQNRIMQAQKVALDNIIRDLGTLRLMGKQEQDVLEDSRPTSPTPEAPLPEIIDVDMEGSAAARTRAESGELQEDREDQDAQDKESEDEMPLAKTVLSAVARPFVPGTSRTSTPILQGSAAPSPPQPVREYEDVEMGELQEEPFEVKPKQRKAREEELEEGEASDESSELSEPPDD